MKLLFCVALLVSSMTMLVEGFSGGAPIQACDTLSPSPTGHGAQPQATTVPYSVDIAAFMNNGTYSYYPGQTYTLSVSGNNAENFRGFFVQARLMSDDTTRVGVFIATDTTRSRLSSCPIDTDGVTHNSNVDKTTISFNWTAPAMDMGTIRFGFAVVQVQATYWANQRTAAIYGPQGPPVTTQGTTTDNGASTGPPVTTQRTTTDNGASGLHATVSMWMLLAVALLALYKL